MLSISMTSLANNQMQVTSIEVDVGYGAEINSVTDETEIQPTLTVEWTNPSPWADGADSDYEDKGYHEPDYYDLTVNNVTLGDEETITITQEEADQTSNTIVVNPAFIETGSLYRLYVEPYHYHEYVADGVTDRELVLSDDPVEVAYALTELDVDLVSSSDSIEVIWDNVDVDGFEFEYRITYGAGESSSTSIDGLTSDRTDVQSFYDDESKRQKLSHTLSQNINPGQIYSVTVEVTTEYYNGHKIERNVNNPYQRSVSTDIVLTLTEEGDYLRLNWDIPTSITNGSGQEDYSLVEGSIIEIQGGNERTLVVFNENENPLSYFRVAKPLWETEYYIELQYSAYDTDIDKFVSIKPISNTVAFSPSDYYIQPTMPYIPDLISGSTLNDYEDYLLPDYRYIGDIEDLFGENVTFHVDADNNYINLVWGAFLRRNIDATSETYGNANDYIYDNNVYYDLWVTDELDTLGFADPIAEDLRYSSTSSEYVILNEDEEIIGYKQQLGTYYSTDDKAIIDMTPGKLYYIKIEAKKINANETLTSEPNIVSVYYNYEGDSFEPPTIPKPPLEEVSDETDTTGGTIRWRESWTEVMSSDADETGLLSDWQIELWADENGDLYTEDNPSARHFPFYEGANVIDEFEAYMKDREQSVDLISRTIDLGEDDAGLSDIEYSFKVLRYQTVLDAIEDGQEDNPSYGFEDYYAALIAEDKDGSAPITWESIDPYRDETDDDYLAYRKEGLVPNTAYLFMLYPSRTLESGDVLYAHYPSYVLITTKPEDVTINPEPTVPGLYTTEVSETEVTVTWKYNSDFSYELVYATVDDVDQATAIDYEFPDSPSEDGYPVDGEYYPLLVDDLFPLTTYYFWIKATQSNGGLTSGWSNPAMATTLDVDAPVAPRGLGVASKTTRNSYGYDLSVAEDYMLLEWVLNTADPDGSINQETTDDSKVTWSYAYIIEVAENKKFVDPLYIVSSGGTNDSVPSTATLLDKNVLLVEELIGNRDYYIRAKTLLTVTGSEEGQEISVESKGYTDVLKIITLTEGDEYDGSIDPALTILPDEDYELSYNKVSASLEFRFRSDQVDDDGANDNQVDQRLISSLIDNNSHTYVIDLTSYEDQDIKFRRVTIPYTIMEAFDVYDVDIKILADNMQIDLPAGSVMRHVADQVGDYGVAPVVIIDLEDLDEDTVIESLPVTALTGVAVPQDLQVKVSSARRTDIINYTDTPMSLALKTRTRYEVYDQDLALYVKNRKANWITVEGVYNKTTAMMAFDTSTIGSYGLYVFDRETTVSGNTSPNHWSETYREAVYGAISVEGLSNYNPEARVSESAVVQAVYGTVMDAPVIDLTEALIGTEMQTLQRAGIKEDTDQTQDAISREEAISMFARTLEIVEGETTTVTSTMLAEAAAAGVGVSYRVNVAKAKAQGLITDYSNLRPKESLKYSEYFTLWSRVLEK